jgi:peptidoglycan/xylan/chitin deacetylase (PgdA/CDA1 family)
MNLVQKMPIALILVTGFLFCVIPVYTYDIPASWEGFYHMRIAENIIEGHYFYDTGSFGPEGRTQIHPPIFHALAGILLLGVDPFTAAEWTPPVVFCILLGVWYIFISEYYKKSVALLSTLFLLLIPAFMDIGVLFSPHGLSLILRCIGLLYYKKNPLITGICGGLILMTQFTPAFYFFLVIAFWSVLDSNTSGLKVIGISLVIAFPYLLYFLLNFPSFSPVLGFSGFEYFLSKTTFVLPVLAVLGLRRDSLALSLGGGSILSFLQPANLYFIAFPLVLFAAFFVHDFFVKESKEGNKHKSKNNKNKRKYALLIVFIFLLGILPSKEYVSKLQPAASEYPSFVWLKENSVPSIVASGWYQAPIIASVSDRIPVLGFSFPDETRVKDMARLYQGDTTVLEYYNVTYVYFGTHEQYDYNTLNIKLDKIYSGKGSFYKRDPVITFVLITIDVEYDLPPVLSTNKGMEQGLPIITKLLDTYNIKGTFFVLGETAQKYPDIIAELSTTHEIGCHSMHHTALYDLSYSQKETEVKTATTLLKTITNQDITSFRAPGHSCDNELIEILMKYRYTVEASACKEWSYPYHPAYDNWLQHGDLPILRVPISHTPSYFYPPLVYPNSWVTKYLHAVTTQNTRVRIVVIGVHPWEFVNISAEGQDLYTRACGEYTKTECEKLLQFLDTRSVTYIIMKDLYHIYHLMENIE